MADFNQNIDQAKDLLNLEQKDMGKLPSMLNVLTILTYIGCAFGAIGAVYSYFTIGTSYKLIEGMGTNGLNSDNKAVQSIMSQSMEMVKKQYDNRLMIMILALVGVALCFYGAMQMRNLKKQGYMLYVIGELIPILSFAIFIGFGSLFGGVAMIFTVLIAAVFIILYTTQRKVLIN
jgi:hypothetical protein